MNKSRFLNILGSVLLVGFVANISGCTAASGAESVAQTESRLISDRVNIGNVLALYPKPITVIGAMVDGKVNWRLVGHTGIIGHNKILVSMKHSNYTNRGIFTDKKLSINLVSREILPKADYVGSVRGSEVDKSGVFDYSIGANGSPVIDESSLSMECNVVDVYESEGFDNFICEVVNTYASKQVLDEKGKLDYTKLKPVLFAFPTYNYIATGEILGDCLNLKPETSMCAKDPMSEDGIVRISKIEVFPEYLDEYIKYVTEVGAVSLRQESGVLTMYSMQEKDNPCSVTILEIYASQDAYKKHIATEHFQKYKQGTLHMVKALELIDQNALNKASMLNNYIKN